MKKSLFLCLLLAIVSIMATGCVGCQSEKKEQPKESVNESLYHDYDGVVQDFTAGVSHVQALHRQTMNTLAGSAEYQWRNSRVTFNDDVTLENIDNLHIVSVRDVYCYWNEQGPWVQFITSHVKDGVQIPYPINDVWIEDANLSDKPIKLTCEQALQRLKEWNGVLPKANFITLRLSVGPKDCNPQWTFGNVYDVVFIDAVTGEVRDSDPAF